MRACTFASIATFVTVTGIFIACGGDKSPAKDPGGATTSASGGAGGGDVGNGGPAAAAGDPGSTTLAVPPAGSGQKLDPQGGGGSAPTSSAAPAGSGGHKGGHHEPGRTRDDIRVSVQAHRDEARKCYDDALPTHPGIEGDITLKWTIDPEGNSTNVVVDTQRSTILEPTVGACIGEVIKKLKFSRSGGGYETHAEYPFNFHPKNTPRVRDAGT